MWVKREGERGRGGDMPLRGVAVCEKIRSWHSASAHHGINSARGCGSPMSTEPHATFPPERVSHEYRKEWEGTEENEAKLQARTVPPKHFFTHWGGNNVARSCYTSCTTFCIPVQGANDPRVWSVWERKKKELFRELLLTVLLSGEQWPSKDPFPEFNFFDETLENSRGKIKRFPK